MHLGALILIALIVLACLGPGAVLRALAGFLTLIAIAAILLALLWAVSQMHDHSKASVQSAPSLTQ